MAHSLWLLLKPLKPFRCQGHLDAHSGDVEKHCQPCLLILPELPPRLKVSLGLLQIPAGSILDLPSSCSSSKSQVFAAQSVPGWDVGSPSAATGSCSLCHPIWLVPNYPKFLPTQTPERNGAQGGVALLKVKVPALLPSLRDFIWARDEKSSSFPSSAHLHFPDPEFHFLK